MSEPTFRPDRLVAAGEANDASGQRNGSTLLLIIPAGLVLVLVLHFTGVAFP